MTKNYDYEDNFTSSENVEFRSTLRAENELFNEQDGSVIHSVINVKRIDLKTGEDWEIFVDGESAIVLKGSRFTSAEKDYLRTADGMKFLVSEYKNGKRSVVKIKEELKKVV